MTETIVLSNDRKSFSETNVLDRSRHDGSTSTCYGKLSWYSPPEDDETYDYAEITERLFRIKARLAKSQAVIVEAAIVEAAKDRAIVEPVACGDKESSLPLRRSLFAHVPPYIIFQNQKTCTKLPDEIAKHLLWWRAGNNMPRIIAKMVEQSGFRTISNPSNDWCGTWCSNRVYSKLKNVNFFSKVNCFPKCVELGNKITLWTNFRRMQRRHGSKCFDYMPLTFVLPKERNDLRRFMKRNNNIWIIKPPAGGAGSGIKVVTRMKQIPGHKSRVAQRYISRPLLLDGVKFDIRLYVLLTSINPLRIYLYKEGLVRLATVKYKYDVKTLSNRFMHLTNTSVNRNSPNFQPNDDPDKCKGNMWSLKCLWKYLSCREKINVLEIWDKIKDIAIKTLISAEVNMVKAWKKTSLSTYNFYQLFGFDVLLDQHYRPWLLEVNDNPSMVPDTPLCELVKVQLAKDYLNLVGFHVPDLLTATELKTLKMVYKESSVCFDPQLYTNVLVWKDKHKQFAFSKATNRKEYLKTILRNLTPDDVKVLIKHEDELAQTGNFERIFPTARTYNYLTLFDKVRYYNLLLDAWEAQYGNDRANGIEKLRKLCSRKYHLSR